MKHSNIFAFAIVLTVFATTAPLQAFAEWPASAFAATNVESAMINLFGSADNTPSGKIRIDAPAMSENGAVVPVTVETAMAASAIAIVVEKNGQPLAVNFELADNAKGFIGTAVKVCQTSDIIIVVKSGGKLYTARRNVKVASGNCAAATSGGKPKAKKSIRARARAEGGDVTVQAIVGHPMGAQHITEVAAVHKDKRVVTAHWGPFVSAKPRLSFRFAGATKGDTINLTWMDNQGRSDSGSATIK